MKEVFTHCPRCQVADDVNQDLIKADNVISKNCCSYSRLKPQWYSVANMLIYDLYTTNIVALSHFYFNQLYFSVKQHSLQKSSEVKKIAIDMYLEGIRAHAMGSVLNISHVTAYKWIKKLDKAHPIQSNLNRKLIGRTWWNSSFYQRKNHCWTWIAIDRHTKHILWFVCGRRNAGNFRRWYNHLYLNNIKLFGSDYWQPYTGAIERENTYKVKHRHLPLRVITA